MHRPFLTLGFLLAATAVATSAFGAHALDGRISADRLAVFETAARYHLVHAVALVVIGLAVARWPARGWSVAGGLLLAGITIFSGTLYGLSLSGLGWLGAITPIGGVLLIAGWGWAARVALRET